MAWNTAFREHAHGPFSHTARAQILQSLRVCVYPLIASTSRLQKKQGSREAGLLALFGKCHVQLCIQLRTTAGAYCPCTLACVAVTAQTLDRPLRARVSEINKVVAFLELRNAVDEQIRKPQVKMLGHHYSGAEVWLFLELALWLLSGRPPDQEPVHGYKLLWQGRRKSVCKCPVGYGEENHSLGISSEWAQWGEAWGCLQRLLYWTTDLTVGLWRILWRARYIT